MASQNNGDCLHVTSETYQELLRHAAHHHPWAQYFLLINACLENLKHVPTASEHYDQAEPETLLIEALERLGAAIGILMPGGINEFSSYLAEATHHYRRSEETIRSKHTLRTRQEF